MENEEKNIEENNIDSMDETIDSLEDVNEENLTETSELEDIVEESPIVSNETNENTVNETQEMIEENFKETFDEPIEESSKIELENEPIEEAKEIFEETIEETKPQSAQEHQYVSTLDSFDDEEEIVEELITVRPVKFQQFEQTPPVRTIKKNLDIMQDISLHVSVELGRTKSSIREVMDMEEGSIVELEKIAGEQVEIFVNDKLVAKGEVIVIEDKFGVRVTSTNLQQQIQ